MKNNAGEGSRVFWGQVCTRGEEERERTLAKLNPDGIAIGKEVDSSRQVGRQVQPMRREPGVIRMVLPTRKD